ncbi:MAG TPA: ComEC/Rec2 family competence protein [Saprospiraceae bacterium]|nr:ComEC/Rec2 family competence protein [Saprospiraceae bacterium]HQW55866.1 ComEC/Rec2 family competence protein [Saprospiraceae bacterium]
MITIHELPALRLLVYVTGGISFFYLTGFPTSGTDLLWIILLFVVSLIVNLVKLSFSTRFLYGFLQAISWFLLPGILMSLNNPSLQPHHVNQNSGITGKEIRLSGECITEPRTKKSSRIVLNCEYIYTANEQWKRVTGKVILNVMDTAQAAHIGPGSRLIVKTRLSIPGLPQNPLEFDYNEYLKKQNILLTGMVQKGALTISAPHKSIYYYSYQVRKFVIHRIKHLIGNSEEADLAAGLLVGYRDKIDPATEENFINTGAVHLLAVSGMHVVLIYQNILLLLGFINHKKLISNKIIKITGLLLIWAFAFLAGLAPSVIRATIMLSLLISSDLLKKYAHPLNILFAGALLMLLYEPMVLFDVGFQLSFSAVLGIITLNKSILLKLHHLPFVPQLIKELITVTLAAQIGTLPLILSYFHQFPVYFILSGIVAVFLSDLVIKIGCFLVLGSLIFMKGAIVVAFIWKFLLKCLLISIQYMANLPGVLIEKIYFNNWMFAISLFLLILLFITSFKKLRWYPHFFVAGMLLLLMIDFRHFILYKNTDLLQLYSSRQGRIIEVQKGFQNFLFIDSSITNAELKRVSLNSQIERCIQYSQIIKIPNEQNIFLHTTNYSATSISDGGVKGIQQFNSEGRVFLSIMDEDKLLANHQTNFLEIKNPALSRVSVK